MPPAGHHPQRMQRMRMSVDEEGEKKVGRAGRGAVGRGAWRGRAEPGRGGAGRVKAGGVGRDGKDGALYIWLPEGTRGI